MKQFFINNNSDKLILFFAGWGCDEYEFEHLKTDSDVLIFYDYTDLSYDFDFSKYGEINMLSFSAGVFVGAVFRHDFKINKKVALSGNPYLFDEELGLSEVVLKILRGITIDTCDAFAREYLVMTDEEYKNFHNSHRTLESCEIELDALEKIYKNEYNNIQDVYDTAVVGDSDPLFNPEKQKEFYGDKLRIVKNARHNLFFRVNSYDELFELAK